MWFGCNCPITQAGVLPTYVVEGGVNEESDHTNEMLGYLDLAQVMSSDFRISIAFEEVQ